MSIEVRVPKEITEYKEKIIFGLSLRQLLWGSVALIGATGGYFIGTHLVGMSPDNSMYISMIIGIPAFAMGFFKTKDGFTFDQFIQIRVRHRFSLKVRKYSTNLEIDQFNYKEEQEQNGRIQKPKRKKGARKRKIREFEAFEITEKGRKRKSKEARREIKAARREFKKAKCQNEKKIKKGSSTQKCSANNQI